MRLTLTLTGSFGRSPFQSQPSQSLSQWLGSLHQVATQVRQPSPQQLQRSFGLSFLPASILHSFFPELPSQWALTRPTTSIAPPQITPYHYWFESPETQFELAANDPQLPIYWPSNQQKIEGSYIYTWNGGDSQNWNWIRPYVDSARQFWQGLSDLERLELALQSPDPDEILFVVPSPADPIAQAYIPIPQNLREAVHILRDPNSPQVGIPANVENYVRLYQEQTRDIQADHSIDTLTIDHQQSATFNMIMDRKKSRKIIEDIIRKANHFLFICSYVIENESIVDLICQKAATLPGKVWILTELPEEAIDRMDAQHEPESEDAYQRSTKRKQDCLKMLLQAGALIRSGPFHLKTYISEKSAYLGSCNLTGGSLDFNLESGIISQNQSLHQNLCEAFKECWNDISQCKFLPRSNIDSMLQVDLRDRQSSFLSFNYPSLLTPQQYHDDLKHTLSRHRGKVIIYSRYFFPGQDLALLLQNRDTDLYLYDYPHEIPKGMTIKIVHLQHAKITLIGDYVAYIGSTNFVFMPSGSTLLDLMYKTTNPDEINAIRRLATTF